MEIKEITEQQIWQKFFDGAGSPSFLQSWEWGEFEKSQGYGILRLGMFKKNQLVGIALVIKIRSKRGNFLFIPHGPIINLGTVNDGLGIKNVIFNLIKFLIPVAHNENYSFIRIAPILDNNNKSRQIFSDLGFKKAPIYMHAERVWVLPLDKSEEELLTAMRKTTRYSIKRAARDGVIIKKPTGSNAVDDFMSIYQQTAKRENFMPFPEKFIGNEFECFRETGNAQFFEAVHPQAGILASALIIFTKTAAFYHQGGSIHSKIPAPYLLQWEAIKEAKRRGCQFYNFWGIMQAGRTPKSWGGLTMFKQGFGGKQIDYVPTQDYIISAKYNLTFIYEKYLNWRRGV